MLAVVTDAKRGAPVVPVLIFTGPVGVGKTTVALEASRLLEESGIPVATPVPGEPCRREWPPSRGILLVGISGGDG
ncbi:MAG TPA: hypothetical protein VIX86_25295 [Streptosporangiaceae bacterium]